MPKLVIVESPFAAPTAALQQRNLDYAREALADALKRGEAPFASHLLYTQPGVLDDEMDEQRAQGIAAGFAWMQRADYSVVYQDLGISGGMRQGIGAAYRVGLEVVYRSIEGWKK
ncbi:MAG: hypothetical protein HLX51_01480 [Micrococcaceae bacterium]|nr:hypothetical protein [Micrococcaceae bacterium]